MTRDQQTNLICQSHDSKSWRIQLHSHHFCLLQLQHAAAVPEVMRLSCSLPMSQLNQLTHNTDRSLTAAAVTCKTGTALNLINIY